MTDPVQPGLLRTILERLRFPWRPGRPAEDPKLAAVDAARLRAQVAVIRQALDGVVGAGARGTRPPRDDADVTYLYRARHALAREQDVERLDAFFAERGDRFRGRPERVASPTEGLTLLRLPARTDRKEDVLATLAEIDRELGEGIATPDHVVYVATKGFMCPATEPERPPGRAARPFPAVQPDASAGAGVRVSVVDTGLWDKAVTSKTTPWMQGVLADPEDVEVIDPLAIHPYGGHGTFVAGVVRCLAPGARVEVEGVLTHGGAVFESEIVAQLDQALREEDHPQLISISAGSHTRNGFAMLAFEMLASAHGLDDGEKTLIIAAAGNDGSTEPFWPAAFPWVVAVGSVDADGSVSSYSNHGPWVDVYARGRNLVNAFPTGTYTCYEPPNVGQVRTFDGLAQWSGTSFSTPVVTGLVAARMSATGEDVRQACTAVVAAGAAPTDAKAGSSPTVGPLT